uniref:Uncharacterized protein n=1 Tax=Panagrolaimus sp. PS1159 TaxID=55785 RepID=A0AC35G670_9BILA
MKAAVYFLLLTFFPLISVVNSTCYCSSKTSSADIPSIFAHQQPSTFPVSLPLLSIDEILHHIPPSTAASNVHPFEDLFVYIFFEDGSCVYYMIEDFDVRSAVESTVSDIKEALPSVSELKQSAAPFFDAVEEKVSPLFSSFKDTIAPVLSAPIVLKAKEEISPIIIESYKYGLEYTKNLQERVAPIISGIEDKAASVVEDVISNVKETIAPYISSQSVEAEDNACESFSLSKFLPNVEVMTNSNNGNMENEVDLTIPDEEDFILVTELIGDDDVAHGSPSEVYDVAPHEDAPFLQTLFKLLCILAVGLTSLLSLLYLFVLSIVIYVFIKDYFAEKYDADANEHFRELLNQIRNEHCRRRPAVALPAPPPRKINQEQQTDDEEEEEGNDGGDEYYVIEPADDVFEAPAAAANDEECSSEVDVSMDDTTSHSCA